MIKHPEIFDARKLAIALASGPFVLLLLVTGIDLAGSHFAEQPAPGSPTVRH
ncbi:MAG: hypothetical protein KME35_20685 [Aphanocapsa sp. GSE-SYN-MK-11-07L]|nr:hypothetical protein [Aphanocapsa sp. GSE-SYN-MK-11-07L]